MAIDTDTLLAPVDADNPCGDNTNTTPTFWPWRAPPPAKPNSSSAAPSFRKKRRIGCRSNASRPRCWRAPKTCASCCISPAPRTQLRGLPGYADGLTLIHQSILRYWDALQPALEFDGEADPLFRINALADLGDKAALAASVRTAPLLKSAAGEISLRDAGALLDGSKQECPNFPGGRAQDELAQQAAPKAHW